MRNDVLRVFMYAFGYLSIYMNYLYYILLFIIFTVIIILYVNCSAI